MKSLITLHRDQSGDEWCIDATRIVSLSQNTRGTLVEMSSGFRATVRETPAEIQRLIESKEAS